MSIYAPKIINKFGKKVGDIKEYKKNLIEDNQKLVTMYNEFAEFYKKQPVRKKCKCCLKNIDSNDRKFSSHGLTYMICAHCGHINGEYEETVEFCNHVYADSDLEYNTYTSNTLQETVEYNNRIKDVYMPKACFLKECLEKEEVDINDVNVLDIGTGMGHFVSALDDLGIKAEGIDMGEKLLNYGKSFLHSKNGACINAIDGGRVGEYISASNASVLSAIGVLEHLIDFHEILSRAKDNKNIDYLFISVPTFGFSNFLEMFNPNIWNRHLGGSHTHIFSIKSLDYLIKLYNFKVIGRWSFGCDMMDLFRICMLNISDEMKEEFSNSFFDCIDGMQIALDKAGFCSEIHLLLRVS